MESYYTKRILKHPKIKRNSVKDFEIDASHYRTKGPRIVRTIKY